MPFTPAARQPLEQLLEALVRLAALEQAQQQAQEDLPLAPVGRGVDRGAPPIAKARSMVRMWLNEA